MSSRSEAEHATYDAAPAHRKAYMRANGYRPRPDAPLPSPMPPKTYKHALSVFADPKLAQGVTAADLKRIAIEQIGALTALQREDAMRFTYLGLTLHQLKKVTPHGQWGGVLEEVVAKSKGWTMATTNKNVSYAMRLALAFVELENVNAIDLVALPSAADELCIADAKGATKRTLNKLARFCGDLTRTELLIKHGLVGVGLKTELERAEEDEARGGKAGDYYAELAQNLDRWRRSFTCRETLMRLSPQQLESVNQAVTDGYSQFRRLYEEACGAAKA